MYMQTPENSYGSMRNPSALVSLRMSFPIDNPRTNPTYEPGAENFRKEMPVWDMPMNSNHIAPKGVTILSIGDDVRLLETRQMVFASAGYQVHSATSADVFEENLIRQMDIAVICHSVPPKLAALIACSFHGLDPALPILRLGEPIAGTDGAYDHALQFPPRPEVLLKTVEQIVSHQV
jgi:hypothetical protein